MTWVTEQGKYLLSVQLSGSWEGLQLPWRTDLMFNMILPSLKESGKKRRQSTGARTATQQENQQCKSTMGSDQPRSKPMEEYHELSLVYSIPSPFVKAQESFSSM